MHTGLYFSPNGSHTPSSDSATIKICAKEAETFGYDCLFVAEPTFVDDVPDLNALDHLRIIAAATDSIAIGIANSVIALEEPLAVAQQIKELEELLPNRHIAGVAVGEDEEMFFQHSVPFEQCRDRFEEILDVLPKIWHGEPFQHRGKNFEVTADNTKDSRNTASNDPVIWVTARDIPTLSSAAKRGYPILPYILSEHRVVVEQYQAFAEILERSGHDSEKIARPLVRDIFVANSSVEAEARALDPFIKLYQGYAQNCELLDFKNQPKLPGTCSVKNILSHHLIIGDAHSVAEQLAELTTSIDCTHIIARMHVPGIQQSHALESMSLFKNAVVPLLSDHNN